MRILASIATLLLSATSSRGCSSVDLGVVSDTNIFVCSDSVVRVTHTPNGTKPKTKSLVINADWSPASYKVANASNQLTITTNKLQVVYDYISNSVSFNDADGSSITNEISHSFSPSTTSSANLSSITQSWKTDSNEGIYGGGEYQSGFINWAGAPLSLVQYNTEAAVPFFLSTKGYGLLWDDYSWTHLNDGMEVSMKYDGQIGTATVDLTAGTHNFQVRTCRPWGCSAVTLVVSVTNTVTKETYVGQNWNIINMPAQLLARVDVPAAGTYLVTVKYSGSQVDKLYINPPNATEFLQLRSEASEGIDYYFMWGEGKMDGAVAGYREASGAAYLFGKHAYGFWQCKNRYHNQSELTGAALEFRKRRIPVDNIVQDYKYWGSLGWGPHWDPSIYPDPAGMVKTLHDNDIRFMVSVWARFDTDTTFYQEMNAKGYIIKDSQYYDPYNPLAREMYYNFSNVSHFSIGVDSLWLDATEPEHFPNYDHQVYLGPGNQYMNPFSLMTSTAIADGLRKDYPNEQGSRVFTLTRSSFAGQQRTGAVLWSGDIMATWDSFRRQIVSALNYQMSGIPYWSEDIGGYFRNNGQYQNPDYWCLLTRWFQFGVFTPIFRVHGQANTELWNFGPYVERWVVDSAINLRYRLLPYIYSGFRRVEQEGYTMQRAMPFDFPGDMNVRNMGDQFMFGESLLVAPVYTPNDTNSDVATRSVYLPAGGWWEFNTGRMMGATVGWTVNISSTILQTPIFARAGTILVMGPKIQHTGEAADPLEVRIYRDSDATFTLFEDDGKSPSMEPNHQFSEITFTWSETNEQLTISDRVGSFPGMLTNRTLNVVIVNENYGTGVEPTLTPNKTVTYTGSKVNILF
eukprot:TRINITY_DN9672_c0_g1_i2.p1 TRINITY_DN9672_c0_g1~~TRINITY_DN9672_c0_g1_i2.p1  ORF type:complete len:856 (+),score=192.94 TRINITY_DN9672_c0_g1_i2:108-2675(+)